MTDGKKEWGEFSEWLDRIDKSFEQEQFQSGLNQTESLFNGVSLDSLLEAVRAWIEQLEDAPVTTWKEELSVRGFDYEWCSTDSDLQISEKLWSLLDALAGMRIFVTNTDHLSERQLYELLTTIYIERSVAQIPMDHYMACIIDIVGSDIDENPGDWLRYYASSRERMEWAKQNAGKYLPAVEKLPYSREDRLPSP